MNNVFIIGNGFDLDLGLPTKYSDFAASKYWPVDKNNIRVNDEKLPSNSGVIRLYHTTHTPTLEEAVETAKNRETWFDLEQELLNYAKQYDSKHPNYNYFNREKPYEIKNNVDFFNKLRSSLNDYILEVQSNHTIKKECIACDVLKAVINNGYFDNIYSFNYTDLNAISKMLGATADIKYIHLHGNVTDKTSILGVDETELRKGYESFHKSSSRYYRSHDIYNSLTSAEEIVIFGLSFGSIDYSYFDMFFKQLSEGESIKEEKKKYITVFTKDDNSRLSIISNLRNMGINIQRLYAQSHFQIICTSDDGEKKELSDFYNRLAANSLLVYEDNLKKIAMLVP